MRNNHIQHAIKFGLLLGGLRVLLDVSLKELNVSAMLYNNSAIIGLLMEFAFIFIAVMYFKKKHNANLLSVRESLKIGIVMMIVTSILLFLSIRFYHPEFAEEKYLELTKLIHPEKLDKALIELKTSKENPSYFMELAWNTLKFIFIGLILSLITGVILNKKEN